jgi:uncharacterized protein YbjT (DUF2867 family)
MNYLITGATGNVGSLVVRGLLERGERPRVFVRDAKKAAGQYGDRVDIFVGDLTDGATLRTALGGADVLFLVNSGTNLAEHDELAARTARDAGVGLLVKLSSLDAQQNVGTGVWHARGEAAIRATGIPFAFLQPSGFMSNALFWASSIRAEGIVTTAAGEGKIPFIHPKDIADVAIKALTTKAYVGQSFAITGPEALSYAEMAAKIAMAVAKPVTLRHISDDDVRCQMLRIGDSLEEVEAHLSIYRAIREGRLAAVTDTVERVLGRKPISFDQWVQENVAVFSEVVLGR